MGYSTDFYGSLGIAPRLTPEHQAYLAAFNKSRRVQRDESIVATLADPIRIAAGLPVGKDGSYYVGNAKSAYLRDKDASIIDCNCAPAGQPGLWCGWTVHTQTHARKPYLTWDGGEKFYNYLEWLCYLLEHFFVRWGYKLNGVIEWVGEDPDDRGKISVVDNHVATARAEITWVPEWE